MSSRKKKIKDEEVDIRKEYQYLVTLQIRLDYKDNDTSAIDYIKIFDKKPQAIAYINNVIEENRVEYVRDKIEIKKRKDLSDAVVVQWQKINTNITWTWTYEIFKIEHAIIPEEDNKKRN